MTTNIYLHNLEFLTLLKHMMQISKSLFDFFFFFFVTALNNLVYSVWIISLYFATMAEVCPSMTNRLSLWRAGPCCANARCNRVYNSFHSGDIWKYESYYQWRVFMGFPHQYRSLHSVLRSQSEVIWPQQPSSLLDQIFFTHRNLVFYNFVCQFFWRKVSVT